MAINLEREGIALNAAERNKRNANLTKIEDAINEVGAAVPAAEAAKLLSEEAKAQAIQAEERAAGVETQLNEIVVNGDSSVEAAQARVRSDGTVAATLKARLDGEHQEVTAQLAETTEELDKKQAYEGSLVKLLQDHSALKENIIVKVKSISEIEVGVFHNENRATIYTMRPDVDGWWRQFETIIRPVEKVELLDNYKKGVNYIETTGTWNKNSTPQHYATEVGATFSGTFKGKGIAFNHTADNRGGMWEFLIDGWIRVIVSTFNATSGLKTTHVIKGLQDAEHSFVATFLGDDPNNPPSSGTGTSRGWCNFYEGTGTNPRTITPYINSYVHFNGIPVLQTSSRKEFAFSVRPAGTNLSAKWVPEHGNPGAMKDITTKIFLDGKEIIDLSRESSDNYRIHSSIKFITKYNAYFTDIPETPIWEGRLDQTFNSKGYHVRGKMDFLEPTEIYVGYPAMLAVSKTDTMNDRVVTSQGGRYVINRDINDGSVVNLDGEPVSVAHFTHDTSKTDLKNVVAAFEVFDYKRTMRVGKPGRLPIPNFTQLRADGERKTYFRSFDKHVVNSGEVYDFGCTFFIGELYNASEILP